MRTRLRMGIVALAVVTALLAAYGSSVRAQPVASIALPAPRDATVDLYAGCNNIALTFPDGTACETVVDAVTPAGVVGAMWRHNAAQNKWDGFSPAAPQASDLKTVNLWDAVWLCLGGAPPPVLAAPTATPPPPVPTAAGPSLAPIDFNQGSADLTFTLGTAKFKMAWTFDPPLPGPTGLRLGYLGKVRVLRQEDGYETEVCVSTLAGQFVTDYTKGGEKVCDGGPGRFRLKVGANGDWTVRIIPLAD
jgi:hypothetical protein